MFIPVNDFERELCRIANTLPVDSEARKDIYVLLKAKHERERQEGIDRYTRMLPTR